eukprot:PhM_4_TR7962/c2_g1_i1/m.49471
MFFCAHAIFIFRLHIKSIITFIFFYYVFLAVRTPRQRARDVALHLQTATRRALELRQPLLLLVLQLAPQVHDLRLLVLPLLVVHLRLQPLRRQHNLELACKGLERRALLQRQDRLHRGRVPQLGEVAVEQLVQLGVDHLVCGQHRLRRDVVHRERRDRRDGAAERGLHLALEPQVLSGGGDDGGARLELLDAELLGLDEAALLLRGGLVLVELRLKELDVVLKRLQRHNVARALDGDDGAVGLVVLVLAILDLQLELTGVAVRDADGVVGHEQRLGGLLLARELRLQRVDELLLLADDQPRRFPLLLEPSDEELHLGDVLHGLVEGGLVHGLARGAPPRHLRHVLQLVVGRLELLVLGDDDKGEVVHLLAQTGAATLLQLQCVFLAHNRVVGVLGGDGSDAVLPLDAGDGEGVCLVDGLELLDLVLEHVELNVALLDGGLELRDDAGLLFEVDAQSGHGLVLRASNCALRVACDERHLFLSGLVFLMFFCFFLLFCCCADINSIKYRNC